MTRTTDPVDGATQKQRRGCVARRRRVEEGKGAHPRRPEAMQGVCSILRGGRLGRSRSQAACLSRRGRGRGRVRRLDGVGTRDSRGQIEEAEDEAKARGCAGELVASTCSDQRRCRRRCPGRKHDGGDGVRGPYDKIKGCVRYSSTTCIQ
jgi:hypothetical protein